MREHVQFDPGFSPGDAKVISSSKAAEVQGYSLLDRTDIGVSLARLSVDFDPDIELDLDYQDGDLQGFRAAVLGELDIDLDRVMNFHEGKPMFVAWQGSLTPAMSRMTSGRLSRRI
jgi:hypothetical protein